ncbi:MAG: phosphatidylserine decarboxylase family protein [Bacteroidota bacterium]
MKLHKEGYRIMITIFFVLAIILYIINLYSPQLSWINYILYASAFIFYFFVVRFFRNPERLSEYPNDSVISSADGTVVVIEEVIETEYFNDKRIQVSVFMSPLNVHVNRFPIDGEVVYTKYKPGRYLVAWLPKSSILNERNSVVIQHKKHQIMMRQIAGALARRIVCYAKVGEIAIQGTEMGMIKFGSRVDLFLPLGSEINVQLEDKVVAGKTVIATLPG